MLHFREHVPRSWSRRVPPAGKRDASAASSGAKRSPGWSSVVRMVSCSPCPGTERTFPPPLRLLLMHMRDRARSCWPHRLWSSLCGLCSIMQESLNLPGGERKEGAMIRMLAQILFRQVCAPKEGILEVPDPPPALCPNVEQTPCVSCADPCAPAASPGAEASDTSRWTELQAQALVVLFTQLAQRRVQAARAQEETHEYGSYHHNPPRADGLRLRTAIHPVTSE
jgi:hypothetical protein